VFDTEGIQNTVRQQSARRAISQASNLGFRHAVSNPSFEYWLLLHFEYCVKTFPNGAAVETALKNPVVLINARIIVEKCAAGRKMW
jgi:hypothetical protein